MDHVQKFFMITVINLSRWTSSGSPDEDGDRFIEIWNLVFMQFEQINKNERINLPKPSIDTGMGLERISALLNNTNDNYNTDIFNEIINLIARNLLNDENN